MMNIYYRNEEDYKKVIEEQKKITEIHIKKVREKERELIKWQAEYIKIYRELTKAKKKINHLHSIILERENTEN